MTRAQRRREARAKRKADNQVCIRCGVKEPTRILEGFNDEGEFEHPLCDECHDLFISMFDE